MVLNVFVRSDVMYVLFVQLIVVYEFAGVYFLVYLCLSFPV